MQEKHSFTSSGRGLQPATLLLSQKLHAEKMVKGPAPSGACRKARNNGQCGKDVAGGYGTFVPRCRAEDKSPQLQRTPDVLWLFSMFWKASCGRSQSWGIRLMAVCDNTGWFYTVKVKPLQKLCVFAQLLPSPVMEGCCSSLELGRQVSILLVHPRSLPELNRATGILLVSLPEQQSMQNTAQAFEVFIREEGVYNRADNSQPRGKPKELFRHVRPIGNQMALRCHWAKTLLSLVQCCSSASGKSYFVGSMVLVNYPVSFSTVDI